MEARPVDLTGTIRVPVRGGLAAIVQLDQQYGNSDLAVIDHPTKGRDELMKKSRGGLLQRGMRVRITSLAVGVGDSNHIILEVAEAK